ncbi:hypothetical protein, partial [Azospirillum oleiclasticum]|uniref:hypothetical protein n=1 Tax=Azospirillum oleiclasticum TaxID=2735135 RepID=UPI001B3C0607
MGVGPWNVPRKASRHHLLPVFHHPDEPPPRDTGAQGCCAARPCGLGFVSNELWRHGHHIDIVVVFDGLLPPVNPVLPPWPIPSTGYVESVPNFPVASTAWQQHCSEAIRVRERIETRGLRLLGLLPVQRPSAFGSGLKHGDFACSGCCP